jgi:hypothetical protein
VTPLVLPFAQAILPRKFNSVANLARNEGELTGMPCFQKSDAVYRRWSEFPTHYFPANDADVSSLILERPGSICTLASIFLFTDAGCL